MIKTKLVIHSTIALKSRGYLFRSPLCSGAFLVHIATLVTIFFGLTTFAQQTPTDTACFNRSLPLNIADSKGLPIRGLGAPDFQAKLQGRPVKILSVVPDDRPHRIVILIDASGSMATKWKEVLTPATTLAEVQLPNTQMALLIFREGIVERIDFSQGQNVVAEKLRQIRAHPANFEKLFQGKTALYDSLLEGLQLLDNPTSADSLYLVSDGGDTASRAKFDEVASRLTSSRVRLYVSLIVGGLGYRSPTPEEAMGPQNMNDLAKRTGGEVDIPFSLNPPTNSKEAAQVVEAMAIFHQRMVQNYRMEVELSGLPEKRSTLDLKLSVQDKERWKNVRLTYPTKILLCAP